MKLRRFLALQQYCLIQIGLRFPLKCVLIICGCNACGRVDLCRRCPRGHFRFGCNCHSLVKYHVWHKAFAPVSPEMEQIWNQHKLLQTLKSTLWSKFGLWTQMATNTKPVPSLGPVRPMDLLPNNTFVMPIQTHSWKSVTIVSLARSTKCTLSLTCGTCSGTRHHRGLRSVVEIICSCQCAWDSGASLWRLSNRSLFRLQ